VESGTKKPHKMNFCLQKRGKRGRFESRKSLIYKGKTLFSTFPRFSKTFSPKNIQKDILALISGNWVKMDYYPRQIRKVASTF